MEPRRRDEPQQGLVDHGVAEEVRFAAGGGEHPGSDHERRREDGEHGRAGSHPPRRARQCPARRRPGEQRDGGPDRSLGEHREPDRETGERPPASGRTVEPRPHEAVERSGDERGEGRVEDREPAENEHDGRGRRHGSGHERPRPTDQHGAERRGQGDGRDRTEHGG